MPRHARIQGEYLHIIVRGIGKQILFEDDDDRKFFINMLQKYRDEQHIVILAYCLMENHVHLLIQDTEGNTPLFMKKCGVSYAAHYNKKYDRVGPLFQGRYKSELVGDSAYMLDVFRYILKNPEKAGISSAKNYQWSSFNDYGKEGRLSNTSLIESLLGDTNAFRSFMMREDEKNTWRI